MTVITVCLLPCAYYRMLITVCLLPYAYYRMLITVCLLPYAYYRMLITVCSRVKETCQRDCYYDDGDRMQPCPRDLPKTYCQRRLALSCPSRPLCPPPLPAPSARPLCPPPLPVPPLHRCQEFDAKHTHTRAPARANPDGLCYHYDDV